MHLWTLYFILSFLLRHCFYFLVCKINLEKFQTFGADELAQLDFHFPHRTFQVDPRDLLSGSLQLFSQEQVVATCSQGQTKHWMRIDYLFYQNHRHLLVPKRGWKKKTQFTCKNGHLKHGGMSFYLRIWNVRIKIFAMEKI